jgi:hypothetical protein
VISGRWAIFGSSSPYSYSHSYPCGLQRALGDFRFKLFGREFFLPITTTVVISLLASLIAKWL